MLWAKACGTAHSRTVTANHEFLTRFFIAYFLSRIVNAGGTFNDCSVKIDRNWIETLIQTLGKTDNFCDWLQLVATVLVTL